jgi:HAD superfamily hydrolase (TIGR01509 family)
MIEAVIFDMDGLLFDSEIYWERARREFSASQGCTWRHEDELTVKGLNSPEWAAVIKRRCELDVPGEEVIDSVVERMREQYAERLPLLPGAVDAVRNLAATYPLGLASSSPETLIQYVLNEADILSCFRAVVSSDTVGKGKPNPDVFLATADRLRRAPADIAVLEDSSAGIRAARAAGMKVIAVPNHHYPPDHAALAEADRVLASLLELRPDMMLELVS